MELNSPTNDSVLDFLYVDRARIAQFAAQLLPEGNTHQVKVQRATKDEETSSGTLDAVIAKGSNQWLKGSADLIEHTSDSSWEKVKALLAHLQEQNYLYSMDDNPRVGDLVKFEAYFEVISQNVFRKEWEPLLRASLASGQMDPDLLQNVGLSDLAQLISVVPQPTILLAFERILNFSLWGILKEDGFVGHKDDFGMMFGGMVPGDWRIIAVLDVFPEITSDKVVNLPAASEALNGIQIAMAALRGAFGRPYDAVGITPICIYRELRPIRPKMPRDE